MQILSFTADRIWTQKGRAKCCLCHALCRSTFDVRYNHYAACILTSQTARRAKLSAAIAHTFWKEVVKKIGHTVIDVLMKTEAFSKFMMESYYTKNTAFGSFENPGSHISGLFFSSGESRCWKQHRLWPFWSTTGLWFVTFWSHVVFLAILVVKIML